MLQEREGTEMNMTVKEVLVAARDRVEKNWFKGHWRDNSELSDEECGVCTLGAINFVLDGNARGPLKYSDFVLMRDVEIVLMDNLPVEWIPLDPQFRIIPQFNDDPRTTKADIIALYDRAIESCD
jgi:hypothetical protein